MIESLLKPYKLVVYILTGTVRSSVDDFIHHISKYILTISRYPVNPANPQHITKPSFLKYEY